MSWQESEEIDADIAYIQSKIDACGDNKRSAERSIKQLELIMLAKSVYESQQKEIK